MKKRRYLIAMLVLAAVLSLTGCGGSSAQSSTAAASYAPAAEAPAIIRGETYDAARDYGYNEMLADKTDDYADADEADYEEEYENPQETGGSGLGAIGGSAGAGESDRKIVVTVDLALQTMEFENGTKDITTLVNQYGGYIQDSYVEGSNLYDKYLSRTARYTARVPKARLNEFLESVESNFNVVHQQQSSTDISANYYDNKARLESLRVQEERLLEMLKQSNELKYMLQVENELANVMYEIERITSSLNRMDDSVSLSTITIRLEEVVKYEEIQTTPVTFSDKAGNTLRDSWSGFVRFLQGLVLFLIALLPFLPLIAVIVIVVIVIVRRQRKRSAQRRAQSPYRPVYTMPMQNQPPAEGPPADNGPEDGPGEE